MDKKEIEKLINSLDQEQKSKLMNALANKSEAERILRTPEAQAIMKKLKGGEEPMDDMSQKLMSLMNDPEIMSKIQGLSGLLSQGEPQEQPKPKPPEPPPKPNESMLPMDMMGTMMKIMPILNTFKEDDETTCLLKALRPFLSEEKRKKLDEGIRLMRIMRLLPLLKGTDMFEMFR